MGERRSASTVLCDPMTIKLMVKFSHNDTGTNATK